VSVVDEWPADGVGVRPVEGVIGGKVAPELGIVEEGGYG